MSQVGVLEVEKLVFVKEVSVRAKFAVQEDERPQHAVHLQRPPGPLDAEFVVLCQDLAAKWNRAEPARRKI